MQQVNYPRREIKSYVCRNGRMRPTQRHALATLWQRYGVFISGNQLDLETLFGRRSTRILEIGFGMGHSLLQMAKTNPHQDFLGIEVHKPGIGALLMQLALANISNVRVIHGDAIEILTHNIPDNSLDGVQVFFPDPWPKRRHQKRRLVQLSFLELIHKKLKNFGYFHMATDWQDYAESVLTIMDMMPGFINAAEAGNFSLRPNTRPITKFEARGKRLGHSVWDLIFNKVVIP